MYYNNFLGNVLEYHRCSCYVTFCRHSISKLTSRLIQTLGESASLTKMNLAIPSNDKDGTDRWLVVAFLENKLGRQVSNCGLSEVWVKSRCSEVSLLSSNSDSNPTRSHGTMHEQVTAHFWIPVSSSVKWIDTSICLIVWIT